MKTKIKTYVKKNDPQIRLTSFFVMAFSAFVILVTLFVKFAQEVREQETLAFDAQVLLAINGWSDRLLDIVMPTMTEIGGAIGVTALTAVAVGLFVYKNEYRRALLVLVGVVGAVILNLILKSIFQRQRPELWELLVNQQGFSFPSGHAMASAAFGIAIAMALWKSRWRWWAFVAATGYILFVGFSRLYLGVHYPTDVLAGWCVSGAWLVIVMLVLRTRTGKHVIATAPTKLTPRKSSTKRSTPRSTRTTSGK